ncbi:hypothetical protein HPB47_010284 [Ixodes persulcatus]|uniref:Uncharacterized protein n=1 Tax=Ixodes persulcatus TaxID=34615 RepID=A0AC60NZQ9_IXOPE|nr:hypothetical protein HPB47_010284 [Ixodes persulcatus]
MYSFEGDFRQKPEQALGGASRKVYRDDLLKKSALRRQTREEYRRQQLAALRINACVRGFLSRLHQARELRREFDAASRVPGDLGTLLRSLTFFYNADLDGQRLVWLSQLVLSRKEHVASQVEDPVWRLRIRNLLALNTLALAREGHPTGPSLRVLEVFGSPETYASGGRISGDSATALCPWLQQLWLHLAQRCHFYPQLRRLLATRVPDPGPKEEGTPQVVRLVLPALESRWPVPGEPFLRAVLSLPPSAWLLQALVRLSSPREPLFLPAVAHLTPCLGRKGTPVSAGGDMEDGDFGEMLDSKDSNGQTGQEQTLAEEVLEDALARLDSPETVSVLVEGAGQPHNMEPLCQLGWALLLMRPMALHECRLLYTLAFMPSFLRRLWQALCDARAPSLFTPGGTPLLQLLSSGVCPPGDVASGFACQLSLFCSLLAHLLPTLHDTEFYESQTVGDPMPFSLDQLVEVSGQLRTLCLGLLELCFPETRTSFSERQSQLVSELWKPMFKAAVTLVRQLYARDSRRSFCPEGHWVSLRANQICPERVPDWNLQVPRLASCGSVASRKQLEEEGPPLATSELRSVALLQEMPFVVPFPVRVRVLQSLIAQDKSENMRELSNFLLGPQIHLVVRRDYLYEDALEKLSGELNLKLKLRVQLVNAAGLEEAGVDGGGLMREFLGELMRTAFDPNRGLFRCTHDRRLYPNPAVSQLPDYGPLQAARQYTFVGRMLAKALYEGMLVELPLAHFFLAKLVSPGRGDLDLHHLASLEPLVYRNLLFLKGYPGDVAELGLDFTVLSSQLGHSTLEELKPGGASIPVTAANRIEYMHLMADHLLNAKLRQQCLAPREVNLSNTFGVVNPDWHPSLSQVLISGAQSPVDLEDLRQHTHYEGGYTADHPVVRAFWKVLEGFDERQRRLLLKFVTSCSRPPLLGFKDLEPQFCIQSAGAEPGRLPTASTCMNLLKLPEIPDESMLRDKLLYAIESGAGFELS